MPARPLEDSFQVRSVLYLISCGVVERCIVDGTDNLTRNLVAQLQEMREIVFAECGIVLLQPANALLFLHGTLADKAFRVRNALYLPAVFLPLLLYLLELRYCCHSVIL